jgi:integrase/recombinase XerD
MKCIVSSDIVLSRPLEGPISAHIPAFAAWARERGYARRSRYRQVLLASCFSRWLRQHGVGVRCISAKHPAQYLRSRARRVQIHQGDAAAVRQFLDFLRHKGVVPEEKIAPCRLNPVECEIQAFQTYLRSERILAEATIVNYVPFVRGLLEDRFGNARVALPHLSAGDVVRFVQRRVPHLHLKRAKLLTTALRAFLHYARYRGDVVHDLAAAVPCVANWSMPSIPRAIPAVAVRQLLRSISRRTAVGRRDYAIVLLLARLGLRAGEVVHLELEGIDWNTGCVSIRGKGGQRTALPLPAEVGAAIAAYLQHGRPQSASRRVFLRAKAPIRGFLDQRAVGSLVRNTLARAGINTPSKGAHQFRHALATQMLRHGASLTEIGQVLRHRDPQTTTIYVKVDLDGLRPLALRWPGGAR